ncbi:hypothetical protein I3679_014490 [Proteus mirabilis]|uniref:Uncharacterized protein n=1 Tax=Proteus mirabilis TaxID=584 RepID=A0ABD5LTR7_PROMI
MTLFVTAAMYSFLVALSTPNKKGKIIAYMGIGFFAHLVF